ncbi:MAG: DUF6431 domain-containing protein [Chloroflexota bacterium]
MYVTKAAAVEQTIAREVETYLARLRTKSLQKPPRCLVCGHACALRWHGSYARSLITLAQTYVLPVKRLLCLFCGHTFALLPEFVLKFHRYAKAAILHAVRILGPQTYEAVAGMFVGQGARCTAILTLHLWRRKFA